MNKIITASSASELNKLINKYESEGWKAIGSHYVVEKHRQNRFRGSELVDTIIESEYSISIQNGDFECYCPFNSMCINCPNGIYAKMPELRNADGTYGSWGTSGNNNPKQHIIDIMKADEQDGLYDQNK
jgi:hypothetical protein